MTPIIPQEPYKGTAAAIPGKVEVENYDVGGSGKAYLDKDDENKGGEYREDAVDIVKAGEGYAIGYTQEGEWLEYTVDVAAAGEYGITVSYATSSENAGIKLYVDDIAVTDNVIFPQGADWETYSTFEAGKVNLSAGKHVLKLEIVGNYVNIDWLEFCSGGKCNEEAGPTPGDSTTTLVQNYWVDFGAAQTYGIFSLNGRLLGKVSAASLAEAHVKARNLLHRGSGLHSRYLLRAIH